MSLFARVEQTDEFLAELGIDRATRRYFRYPMLQEGESPAKRNAVLKYFRENGYRVAPVTVDTHDFMSQGAYSLAGADARKMNGRRS